jgi:CCR4-NOT transcriptional regulation complex NOT5 subunit
LRAIGILLRRLENTPKQEEAFLAGVAELKAIFQQHLRDEKGALLPKVQKALGDEEIQKVAERVEADRAGAEATARREADVQRARARLERETEQARQAAAEAAQREARRLEREKRANERAARAAAEAAEATEAAEREARERLEQSARTAAVPVVTATAMGTAGASEAMEMLQSTAETARSHATAVPADLAFAQAAQDASREWMSWAQTRAQNQVAGLTALLQCRTLHDVIGLQGRLVREDMELFMATGARISGIAAASSPAAAGSVDPNS